ncbi:MAG: hypothetical protein A2Z34_08075 [Planctomycetes bacterium RBG_16_59_8]|nr:MAG: hypothetical protein A2Z34_08075 [Planctomycetes bacterium RBG_16_59_8]
MKRLLPLLAMLALLVNCAKKPEQAKKPDARRAPKVATTVVATSPLRYEVESVGSIESDEVVSVAAGVPGVVTKVNFKEGETVTPDRVLCVIDETRYELEVSRARAERDRAGANLTKATSDYDKKQLLFGKNYITEQEISGFKALMDSAKAELDRAEASLKLAEKSRNDSSVRSPIGGVINSKNISTGEYARPESVVATLIDLSRLSVRFAIPEVDSGRVKKDMTVSFTTQVHGSALFHATIYWINQTADVKTRTVQCKAAIKENLAMLKPGYSTTVRIAVDQNDRAILVPAEAVISTEKGFILFVLEGKVARERPIKIGVRARNDQVEIRDGLKEQEILIVRGATALRDGMEVEVSQ